mmetsp:Transcript_10516/g.22587  ORF Transcript_10516/g.22587 Transcript_10516/m.22587 type:complete len:378 (-) Transcript_10516:451-1584(-)|eukprot:CAMPEP_0202891224 /NCGR_PEP_ID=MMETSP1392-20130828/1337_1 /ASSEMBLY_ACC=CAM_ASM_000868 /TAXON_ID=225041 /ORGANISM="Chlamydomonas chlamydogama, Strain SAG 11-48b" /LENGTH=377 /DNA_ID=CAMNT_0049574913 /DNA_START=155 /DNA_END=1288 /DNA_ORIENTATION=-
MDGQEPGAKRRKLLLRLDDGSLIGCGSALGGPSGDVLKVPPQKAIELSRVTDAEVHRLERLVAQAQQLLGPALGSGNAPSMGVPNKRPRADSGHLAQIPQGASWVAKCTDIVMKIAQNLGGERRVFWDPVDAKLLPDYYVIIKNPITLGQMKEKLDKNVYQSPQEFFADMKLCWQNCRTYNPANDPYHKLGNRQEELFYQLWASSGLADNETRAKRMTAGVAAAKFEHASFEAPPKPKVSGKSQGTRGAKRPSRANGAASHEVTSGNRGHGRDAPLSAERKQWIGETLSSLPEQHMDELMSLLPPSMLEGADGEFELDFESLDDATLRKIDAMLQRIYGNAPRASPSYVSHNPSVRLDDDPSDSDPDTDPEDEDSDD